jgi:hypothetical protein
MKRVWEIVLMGGVRDGLLGGMTNTHCSWQMT